MTYVPIPQSQSHGPLIHGSYHCTAIEESLAEHGQKPHYRTVECLDCRGHGDSRAWGYDRSWGWCHDCSGTGRVPELVGYRLRATYPNDTDKNFSLICQVSDLLEIECADQVLRAMETEENLALRDVTKTEDKILRNAVLRSGRIVGTGKLYPGTQ